MSDVIHDLTMLYLQNQDIKLFSPEELYKEYKSVYEQIKNYHDAHKKQGMTVLK